MSNTKVQKYDFFADFLFSISLRRIQHFKYGDFQKVVAEISWNYKAKLKKNPLLCYYSKGIVTKLAV